MLLLLRFFRSSEEAIRVVSTRRESDGSLMRLLCSRKEKVLCSNKECENENKFVSRIVLNWFACCKSEFFLVVKTHG